MPRPDHPGWSRPATGRHSRSHPGATQRRPPDTRPPRSSGTVSKGSPPPLPLTVWRCGTTRVDVTDGWPTAVVAKIVTSFSAPSDVVALLDDRANPGQCRTVPAVATIEELSRGVRVLSALAPVTALLDDPVEAQLVIATLNPYAALGQDQVRAWAGLLRPGGVLAVLTHAGHHSGRLIDPTGTIVTAAQAADLLYLQHIVVVPASPGVTAAAPARGDASSNGSDGESSVRPCTRHRRVHADLLIFLNTAAPVPAGRR